MSEGKKNHSNIICTAFKNCKYQPPVELRFLSTFYRNKSI